MQVLVTGGSGFIGRHLIAFLHKKGVKVCELQNLLTPPEEIGPVDHIFHLAAKTSIPESWIKPEDYLQINGIGTFKMLQVAQKTGCSLTYLSTYPPSGVSPHFYGLSKHFGEELCAFFPGSRHNSAPRKRLRPSTKGLLFDPLHSFASFGPVLIRCHRQRSSPLQGFHLY